MTIRGFFVRRVFRLDERGVRTIRRLHTQTISTPGSGLVFNNTYSSSCTAAFIACIVSAEEEYESLFTNSDTINLTFQMVNQGNNGDALDNGWNSWTTVSYATLRSTLLKFAPSDVLPTTSPAPAGTDFNLPESYARMLGLNSSTPATDDTVTINTYYAESYGQDVINGLLHEISEGGLGRVGGLGDQNGVWSTMDLFRYTSSGVLDDTDGRDGQTTYFSSDGGAELSNQDEPDKGAPTLSFNNEYNSSGTQVNTGDTADWTQENVYGSTGDGETLTLTQTELDVMEALGWHLSLKQDVYEEALGGWETPTSWSTGSMPITPQDAYIGGVSGDMIVTLNSNVTVNSIATSADAEFAIGNGTASTLIAINGTVLNSEDSSSVASGNLGKLGVEPGSALQIGDTFDNAGTLAIGKGAGGSGDIGYLYLNGGSTLGTVTLDGGGTVDLGQLANASDDEIQTYGDILNAPGTSGNGLVNVNNTITGGGLIDLGSFDNQASGVVEASQTGGFFLRIFASTFTNEGTLAAQSGSTLDLGQDGDTGSLTNTGPIDLASKGTLAISGDFTISGSGAIDFKGAGADITSNGDAAATFINDSTINADFSGQIGDIGIRAANDLTFDNDDAVTVSGSGVTLTINTGGHNVLNQSSGVLQAEDDAILAIVSNVNNQGVIAAGSSSTSGTTTGTVDLGADGATGTMTDTGFVAVYGHSDLAIRGNYTVTGSGDIYFKGAGAEITSDGKAAATFTNKTNIVATASGQIGDQGIESANDLTFVNTGNVVASGSGVTLTLNTGSLTINDGGGLLEAEDDAILAINSNVDTGQSSSGSPPGGTIETASGGTVTLSAEVADGVSGSSVPGQVVIDGGTFKMLAGSSVSVPIKFTAAGTLEILDAATVSVSGSNGTITASSGDNISLTSGTGDTFTGTNFTVTAASGTTLTIGGNGLNGVSDVVDASNATVAVASNSHVTVNGSSDTVTVGAGSYLGVSGSSDAVTATTGAEITIHSGTGDTVTGAGLTVNLAAGTEAAVGGNGVSGATDEVYASSANVGVDASSNLALHGSSNTVTMLGGSALAIAGSTNSVTATAGDTITVSSGTGEVISGAGFTVNAASGTGLTVGGNGASGATDEVYASSATLEVDASSKVALHGASNTVTMLGGSALAIAGSTNSVTATAGDTITVSSGTGEAISGSGFTVNAANGTGVTVGGNGLSGAMIFVDGSKATVGVEANSRVTLNGSNDTVTEGAGSHLAVNGSTDTITATTDDGIWIELGTGDSVTGAGFTVNAASGTGVTVGGNGLSGAMDVVNGSSATVGVGANSRVTLNGSSDTVTVGAGSHLAVNGSTDAITATTGDGIWINSGTGDTITGAGFTVYGASATGFTIKGTGDIVYAGLNDALTDGGSSDTFKIDSNVGSLKISGFGSDPTGIIDLLSGVGGYTTPAAAFAALTSDGAGGSKLSLGTDGLIDLLGVAPGALKVTNFEIS